MNDALSSSNKHGGGQTTNVVFSVGVPGSTARGLSKGFLLGQNRRDLRAVSEIEFFIYCPNIRGTEYAMRGFRPYRSVPPNAGEESARE
ncbi:hypothetical protein LTR15_010980 [Elasticomyces elasticus]|nr:hypothetical protein LTR15_010980 [Elasticomyces elasticus]